jgi:carbonic anhydrase
MFPLLPDPTAPGPAPTHHAGSSGAARRAAGPSGAVHPRDALDRLLSGNNRFASGAPRYGRGVAAALAAAAEPRPYAVVLGCMDARVAVEAVLDQDFGDVCVLRSAGHVVDRTALGSIELAVTTFGIGLVLVLGHTRCAAVASALTMSTRRLPGRHTRLVLDEIRGALQSAPASQGAQAREGREVAAVTRQHVARTAAHLRSMLPAGPAGAPVAVAGAVYDVDSGRVTVVTAL